MRFTDKQIKRYYEKLEDIAIRSECPSGVCIDFISDTKYIIFPYELLGAMRPWFSFDIYVNDVMIKSKYLDCAKDAAGCIEFSMSNADKKFNRITIYLPHTVKIAIGNLGFSQGAVIKRPERNELNLLCLGDSITQGMDAVHPSLSYPVLLSKFLNTNLLNQGVGGYVFDKHCLDRDCSFTPDIITVAYGTNDWCVCRSYEEFYQNCEEFMHEVCKLYPDALKIVIKPIWRNDIGKVTSVGEFYDVHKSIEKICSKYANIITIDGTKLVFNTEDLFVDNVHPTDEGHYQIAEGIYNHIVNYFDKEK